MNSTFAKVIFLGAIILQSIFYFNDSLDLTYLMIIPILIFYGMMIKSIEDEKLNRRRRRK